MRHPIPALLSWSGGKDSALALQALEVSDEWRVSRLLTTVSAEFDRIAMHGVRRRLLETQAAALRLPLTTVELPAGPSNDEYERRMAEALRTARQEGIERVVFGDLFLEEVRSYREAALRRIGMGCIFPIWGEPTGDLARRFIADGFRAILTCVDTTQLDPSFAGREYDLDLLRDLPPTADPCGENGEFHTFVYAGPVFASPLEVERGECVLRDGRFMYCDLG